jgi:hypothetical protein
LCLFVCLQGLQPSPMRQVFLSLLFPASREREGGTKRFTCTISVQCTNRDPRRLG